MAAGVSVIGRTVALLRLRSSTWRNRFDAPLDEASRSIKRGRLNGKQIKDRVEHIGLMVFSTLDDRNRYG